MVVVKVKHAAEGSQYLHGEFMRRGTKQERKISLQTSILLREEKQNNGDF
jgi:hypothetical protein